MRESATGHRAEPAVDGAAGGPADGPADQRADRHRPERRDIVGVARATVQGWREERWFLPALAVAGAVVLVLAAYLLGRAVAGDEPAAGPATGADGRVVYAGDSSTHAPGEPAETDGKPWQGTVTAVDVRRVRATCTAKAGVDSGGKPVSYRARNVLDHDPTTAWRCDGEAHGVRLVFRLPGPTALGEVGLVPGYAKTDPVSGADRYAQNNRITQVRWTIGDISVEQTLSGDPGDRSVQLLRIPRTTASRVTLEIVAVDRGPRNTTAISEVRFGRTTG
jgi:hypothetical protein